MEISSPRESIQGSLCQGTRIAYIGAMSRSGLGALALIHGGDRRHSQEEQVIGPYRTKIRPQIEVGPTCNGP